VADAPGLSTQAQIEPRGQPPRVAFFADAFHEVNGAARTCRLFEQFARKRGLPFLSIHCGDEDASFQEGPVTVLQMRRSRMAFLIDTDLKFAPLLQQRFQRVQRCVLAFGPDIGHVTGPGDLGIMGVRIARSLRVPLVIAWHAKVDEYAATRFRNNMAFLPKHWTQRAGTAIESFVLSRFAWFYGLGQMLLAPNPELIALLEARTGRPVSLMPRGVDTDYFSPAKRRRGILISCWVTTAA
jgi:phosphatidylinositol alpha 1,6-mannosyltransferase